MKGLEALEKLKQNNIDNSHLFDDELLSIIEKELKALEIIKECCSHNSEYIYMSYYKDKLECGYITQEEYDLLKEVLK